MRISTIGVAFAAVAGALVASPAAALFGVTDQVPGATLVAPFLEAGVDPGVDPENTLITAFTRSGTVAIRWTVWTIDGIPAIAGNDTIADANTWSRSFRDLVIAAPRDARDLLVDGAFYRGFMTIDVVSEPADGTPFDFGYPFAETNALLGYLYFTRLAEGSANSLPMIPLERTASTVSSYLTGFYGAGDFREEIDGRARRCAVLLQENGSCTAISIDPDTGIDRIRARVWKDDGALSIGSRVVVFAWNTARPQSGGPSNVCGVLGCPTSYSYVRLNEGGGFPEIREITLPHVVNVIEVQGPNGAGEVILRDIPDPDGALQIFAFSISNAQPAGSGQNWDAILEASILPED